MKKTLFPLSENFLSTWEKGKKFWYGVIRTGVYIEEHIKPKIWGQRFSEPKRYVRIENKEEYQGEKYFR